MPHRLPVAALALVLVLTGHLAADIIHYKDGRKLEGEIIEETAGAIKVKTGFGTFHVERSKIARIEEKPTPQQELARRRAEIPDDDAPALYQLALWAKETKLRKQHKQLLDEVLAADPEHRGANELLGRARVDGRWMAPDEVDAYVKQVEAEKRAQGLIFHEGEFRPAEEVMRLRGFRRYEGEWLPRREAETKQALDDLATLVEVDLRATEGEFVTIFSDLDAEVVEELAFNLDAEVADFLRRLDLNALEVAQVTRYDIPIYLLPDQESIDRFVTSGFYERYPQADHVAGESLGKYTFGLHWPRPVLVLGEGDHLDVLGDRRLARLGLLSHHVATLCVERLKGDRNAPSWARAGLTAWYEGATNYYGTLSISLATSDVLDEEGRPDRDVWVHGWQSFPEWRERLRDEDALPRLDDLERLMARPWHAMDSQEVGVCWSFVRFLLERHKTEFVTYLRVYDSAPDKIGGDPGILHDSAWATAFASTLEEIGQQWHGWALAQLPAFPADELNRQ